MVFGYSAIPISTRMSIIGQTIDRTGQVITDKDAAIGQWLYIRRPPPRGLVMLKTVYKDRGWPYAATGTDRDCHHPVSRQTGTVP